jgi:uncharacterized phiE125 gp8 family phage protein
MVDLETLVPPVAEPVSLAEAKAWLRIGTDGDDAVLSRLIAAARARFEKETGRALMARTVRERFIPLPRANSAGSVLITPALGPVTSVVEAKLIGADGSLSDTPAGFVQVAGRRLLVARSVPGLVVTYAVGVASAALVTLEDKAAVLAIVVDLQAQRDRAGGVESRASSIQREPSL